MNATTRWRGSAIAFRGCAAVIAVTLVATVVSAAGSAPAVAEAESVAQDVSAVPGESVTSGEAHSGVVTQAPEPLNPPVSSATAAGEADPQGGEAVAAAVVEWTESWTQEETVTVWESAEIGGFVGQGSATATASATATETAVAPTLWEAYYWAVMNAAEAATAAAKAKAEAQARPLAVAAAEADAWARYEAAVTAPEPDPGVPVTDPDPGAPPTGPFCGPQILKADGTPWACTFVDDFLGTEVDRDKWLVMTTEQTAFTYGDCFLDHTDNVSVANGALRLTTRRVADPVICNLSSGPFSTHYTSGSLSGLGKFSQTYGRFEIRAAMPEMSGPGVHSALWLVPDVPWYYGGWPHSGEIDIAEFYSHYPDRLIPAIHYDSVAPWHERTNNYCLVDDPTAFHTYVLEWTPERIAISIDGQMCLDHAISPRPPLTGSAPFDRPFNITLSQMLGSGPNVFADGAEFDEATMQVDYVRVWS